MLIDSLKLHTVIVQIRYPEAVELWDTSGKISRDLIRLWPDLTVHEAQPQTQTLISGNINIQTGIDQATITIKNDDAFNAQNQNSIKETLDIWTRYLSLDKYTRVSTRSIYTKDFDTIKAANEFLFGFGLVRWPSQKVFDQPQESELNSFDLNYRFEDDKSFAFLRFRTEKLMIEAKLPAEFSERELKTNSNRFVFDYDRGLVSDIEVSKFRSSEWFKGYNHILRRDLDKVIQD